MKAKILIIPVLLLSVFTFSYCDEDIVRYYELSEAQKHLFPYRLGQVVSFINPEGQIFNATVTQDSTYWSEFTYSGYRHVHAHENYRTVTLSPDSACFKMTLSMSAMDRSFSVTTYNDTVRLWLYISYDDKGIFFSGGKYDDNRQYFYNSMEINGKTYYDVVEKIQTYTENFDHENPIPKSVLYNKTYGILQVKDRGKVLFTINE